MDEIPKHFDTMVDTMVCRYLQGIMRDQGFSSGAISGFRPSKGLNPPLSFEPEEAVLSGAQFAGAGGALRPPGARTRERIDFRVASRFGRSCHSPI